MAEIFGIVAGVLGLLPLCHDGLTMIKNVFYGPKSLELALGRTELQRDRYDEWRDIWKDDDGVQDVKFELYAKSNPDYAGSILRQLARLSQVIFDVRVLDEEYGIKPSNRSSRESKDLSHFTLEDAQNFPVEFQASFIQRCKINLSFMKKCKFMFRKRDTSWNALIDILRDYIEDLRYSGPLVDLEKLSKSEFHTLEKLRHDELQRRVDAAAYEANHSSNEDSIMETYKQLSLAARFNDVVKYERQQAPPTFCMQDFKLDTQYVLSSSDKSTMALLYDYPVGPEKKEHRVVLIEWTKDDGCDNERIRIKAVMLTTPKPGDLLFPKCYGIVEDPAAKRTGLVLAPPTHIGSNLPVVLPNGTISRYRMPVSLKEIMQRKVPSHEKTLDLGIRFRLAKKLVAAVHMMHCAGWVHKNIHSNYVLFFAASQTAHHGGTGPTLQNPQSLGYDEPLFVGFGTARDPRSRGVSLDLTSQRQSDTNVGLHQPPEKHWYLTTTHSRAHDIYSLGCLLLEIGLWKALDEVVDVGKEEFDKATVEIQTLALDLDGLTGSIYGNVVRRCLSFNTIDRTEAETRDLLKFFSEIEASLDRCNA